MNKSITVAGLLTLLAGMGLVAFFHSQDQESAVVVSNTAEQGTAPQAGNSIMPSVSGSQSTQPTQPVQPQAARTAPSLPAGNLSGSSNLPGTSARTPSQTLQVASQTPEQTGTVKPAQTSTQEVSQNSAARSTSVPPTQPAATSSTQQTTRAGVTTSQTQPASQSIPAQASSAQTSTSQPQGATQTSAPGKAPVQPAATTSAANPASTAGSKEALRAGTFTIRSIELKSVNNAATLRISAENPLQVKSFLLNTPERLVVDITGKWENIKLPSVPATGLVKNVRLGRQTDADRLVFDLASKPGKLDIIKIDTYTIEVRLQ